MNTVEVDFECSCFKKSEYPKEKTFNNQREAYQYTNALVEIMNEDFCSTHVFVAQQTMDDNFVIQTLKNPNAGSSCGTDDSSGSCGTSCGC